MFIRQLEIKPVTIAELADACVNGRIVIWQELSPHEQDLTQDNVQRVGLTEESLKALRSLVPTE